MEIATIVFIITLYSHAQGTQSTEVRLCAHRYYNVEVHQAAENSSKGYGLDELLAFYGNVERCAKATNFCYTFWSKDTSVNQTDGITILRQGCWEASGSHNCDKPTCVAHGKPMKAFNHSYFCCCRGNLCNRNMTDETLPANIAPPATEFLEQSLSEGQTIVIAGVIVFVVSLAFGISLILCKLWKGSQKSSPDNSSTTLSTSGGQGHNHNHRLLSSSGLESLKLIEVVGQGRYGCVWRGTLQEQVVAVKVFPCNHHHYFCNERDIYCLPFMDNPALLSYFGSDECVGSDGCVEHLLVLSYTPLGCLQDYLRANTLDWRTFCKMALSIAHGLAHLHTDIRKGDKAKPCVSHRDLNSRNILVKSDLSCCLSDFGFAMKISGSKYYYNGEEQHTSTKSINDVGTLRYMAPEVLEGAVNLRDCESSLKQIDVYALGLVLWETAMRCTDLYSHHYAHHRPLSFPYHQSMHHNQILNQYHPPSHTVVAPIPIIPNHCSTTVTAVPNRTGPPTPLQSPLVPIQTRPPSVNVPVAPPTSGPPSPLVPISPVPPTQGSPVEGAPAQARAWRSSTSPASQPTVTPHSTPPPSMQVPQPPPYKMPFEAEIGIHPSLEQMQVLVSKRKARPLFPDAWREPSCPAARLLRETVEDCWDHDAEARLTALCVEERLSELSSLWDRHRRATIYASGVSPTVNPTSSSFTSTTPAISSTSAVAGGWAQGSSQTGYVSNAAVLHQQPPRCCGISSSSVMQHHSGNIGSVDSGDDTTDGCSSISGKETRESTVSEVTGETMVAITPSGPSPSPVVLPYPDPLPQNPSYKNANNAVQRSAAVMCPSPAPPPAIQPHQGRNPCMERNLMLEPAEDFSCNGNTLIERSMKHRRGTESGAVVSSSSASSSEAETHSLLMHDYLGQGQNTSTTTPRPATPIPYVQNAVYESGYPTMPKQPNVPGNGISNKGGKKVGAENGSGRRWGGWLGGGKRGWGGLGKLLEGSRRSRRSLGAMLMGEEEEEEEAKSNLLQTKVCLVGNGGVGSGSCLDGSSTLVKVVGVEPDYQLDAKAKVLSSNLSGKAAGWGRQSSDGGGTRRPSTLALSDESEDVTKREEKKRDKGSLQRRSLEQLRRVFGESDDDLKDPSMRVKTPGDSKRGRFSLYDDRMMMAGKNGTRVNAADEVEDEEEDEEVFVAECGDGGPLWVSVPTGMNSASSSAVVAVLRSKGSTWGPGKWTQPSTNRDGEGLGKKCGEESGWSGTNVTGNGVAVPLANPGHCPGEPTIQPGCHSDMSSF
ncbi:bone morphogenetic protein receptor type-2-like [Ischnura elegans]|uniref:bone morphogenetic protein receptor type-2-like n=1 Tax=Ischnura elegans TaxID=197161 RepID=UPI001ED87E08|nr:bone morphogenetic protein receptor type-2-like [Ischnura elegans]